MRDDFEHVWPCVANDDPTSTIFSHGKHVATVLPQQVRTVRLTGIELHTAGRGHVVVRNVQFGPHCLLGHQQPWTVLGPDDTITPFGDRVPTVRTEVYLDLAEYPCKPGIHPAVGGSVTFEVVGDLRAVIGLRYVTVSDDQFGPGLPGWGGPTWVTSTTRGTREQRALEAIRAAPPGPRSGVFEHLACGCVMTSQGILRCDEHAVK